MNSAAENNFVETLEYRRFAEFCDACRQCQYIGLCYGSPGVGKTLSARRYSLWDRIQGVKLRDLPDGQLQELARVDALLYTTPVVNTPREIERDIPRFRNLLRDFIRSPFGAKKPADSSKYRSATLITGTRFSPTMIGFQKSSRPSNQRSDRSAASTLISNAPLVTRPDSFWWMKPIA